MVIMLSNSPQVLRQLDPATRSSLQPVPLHFRHYNAHEIGQILADRAERGLRHHEAADLSQIAALTARLGNADVRVAIKTLLYRVTQSDRDLTECFEASRRDIVVDMISDLPEANLLILAAVVLGRSDLAKDVYERYSRLCTQRHEKPFSYVHFYANLSYLQSMGLVALISTKVQRIYTNRVVAHCDPQLIQTLLSARLREQ